MNPLRRAAMLAAEDAAAVRANPQLADVAAGDYAKAAEMRRLAAIAERTRKQREAQERADELARRAAAFDEAVEQHAAAEAAEKARIGKISKSLVASQKRLCAAAVAAQEALSAAQRAANEHDEVVAEAARELLAAGLTASYEDGEVRHDFVTGATRAGTLVLDGRWWLRVDSDAVALRALFGAARAWSGEYHGLAGELRYDPRVRRLEDQSGGLMDTAPLPAAFVPVRPEWLVQLKEAHRELMQSAPVAMSDDTRESLERQRKAEEQRDRHRNEAARRDYAEKRAELAAEKGEAYVRELEQRLFIDGQPFRAEVAV